MPPKKKRLRTTTTKKASSAQPRQEILTAGALADLLCLEPTRTRNRLISIVEELFSRMERLEQLHGEAK